MNEEGAIIKQIVSIGIDNLKNGVINRSGRLAHTIKPRCRPSRP